MRTWIELIQIPVLLREHKEIAGIMTQEGRPIDILIDFSKPAVKAHDLLPDLNDEDKENNLPLSDSIEITRHDSLTLSQLLEFEDCVLQDVTDKTTGSQVLGKALSPDVRLIDEEEFDFDLPFSPSERRDSADRAEDDDEDEVFIGPMGFTEKCIAAGVAEETIKPLSPLRPDQVTELAKEAFSVAYRISNMKMDSPAKGTASGSKAKHVALLFKDTADVALWKTGLLAEDCEPSGALESSKHADISGIQEFGGSTENILESPGKQRCSGTFTKEEPVENLLPESIAQSGRKAVERKQDGASSAVDTKKTIPQAGHSQAPPSKLMRMNSSGSNLIKENVQGSGAAKPVSKDSRAPAVHKPAPGSRKSLQLQKPGSGAKVERERVDSGDSDKSLPETMISSSKARTGLPKPSVHRTQSMKSALPMHGSRLAAPSQRLAPKTQTQQNGQPALNVSTVSTTASTGIPKGPSTKPQLLQPGQLQRRSLAFGRGRGNPTPQTGPLKVPAQPAPKMGDTVERPYNPLLTVGPNSQCPSTPARGEKISQPKKLSTASEIKTSNKSSSSSSSVCGSTPGSVSRRSISLLPTPSKRRTSTAGSLPPPSPLSLASSCSSVSHRSVVSSSDTADSPVFAQNEASSLPRDRRVSGSKPQKALVQNTPDLPKRPLSRWSPLRPKPLPLDEQVSMCTKRTSTK